MPLRAGTTVLARPESQSFGPLDNQSRAGTDRSATMSLRGTAHDRSAWDRNFSLIRIGRDGLESFVCGDAPDKADHGQEPTAIGGAPEVPTNKGQETTK